MSLFTRNHPPQKQQGKMVWTATRIARLPMPGEDAQLDRAVLAGQYRDVTVVTLPGGTQFRLARTKGQTYRRTGLRAYEQRRQAAGKRV